MSMTVFKNARIIDPASGQDFKGELLISDGSITDVGKTVKAPSDATIVDVGGRVIAPGIVDMRAHAVDIDAALAGGVTTIALQAAQSTIIDSEHEVERIRQKSIRDGRLNVYPMSAATRGMKGNEITEIGSMLEAGAKGVSDCNSSITNARVLRRLMEYATYFDVVVTSFAEDPMLAEGGYAHEGPTATRLGFVGIPAEAESLMINRDATLANMTGARLHIALVSSKEGVEAVRAAKASGTKITAAVAPHYLHLNDNALEGFRTFAVVSPPLRGEEDRLALIKGLADGTIDVIVSDHQPRSEDVKRLPVAQAAAGVVGFETMLALTMSHVHRGDIELITALKALTSAPAALLGLDAGTLAVGAPADLMIFEPDTPWVISEKALKSREKNTPFDTLPVQGKVWRTIVGGVTRYKSE